MRLVAAFFGFLLAAGCDSGSDDDEGDAAVRSGTGGTVDTRQPVAARERVRNAETQLALEFFESIVDHHEVNEISNAIRDDDRWDRVVRKTELDQIESLLRATGFDEASDDGHWNLVLFRFRARKAQLNPHDFAEWLLETGETQDVSSLVYMLAVRDPELAVDVIERLKGDSRRKSTSYLKIMRQAARMDPQRAARLLGTMDFENQSISESAALGLMSGMNPETSTPEIMHDVLGLYPPGLRDQYSEDIFRIAGHKYRTRRPENMLSHFPLDGSPWERAVAIQYLESAAEDDSWNAVDMESFLKSDRAEQLSSAEIDRLYEMVRSRSSGSE